MNAHKFAAMDQAVLEKLRSLTPQRRAEAEDFIDFLKARAAEEQLTRAAGRVSEPALRKAWENPDGAEYDRL